VGHGVLESEVDCSLMLEFTPVELASLAMTPRAGVLSTLFIIIGVSSARNMC
jgi:hypothetical protein